jgi:Icc-related predicted phosphoesterase
MRILSFSDWRVQSKEMIENIINEEAPDFIIYAGDDLDKVIGLESGLFLQSKNHFLKVDNQMFSDKSIFDIQTENPQDFKDYILSKETPRLKGIDFANCPLYFVNGNDDNLIEKDGIFYIEKTNSIQIPYVLSEIDNKIIVLSSDFPTLSAGIRYYYPLKHKPSFGLHKINEVTLLGVKSGTGITSEVFDLPNEYVDILIVHIPPLGVLDLSSRFKTKHIGSEKVLNYIIKYQPKFVICGHSHMWGGHSMKIGESTVVNVSSHDSNCSKGNYSMIDTRSEKIEIKSKITKTIQYVRGAVFKSDENCRIYGSINDWYNRDLLVSKNDDIIANLEKYGRTVIADRIRSFSWSKPKIVKKLSFNPIDYALIDVETGIPKFEGPWDIKCKLWLIGIYFKGEVFQFELPKQRLAFLKFISVNGIQELVSWTTYDSKVLRNMKGLEHIKWMDACKRATYSIIWHSYKLHELYDVVFDNVDKDIIDGAFAGLYADHLINKKIKCEYCPSEDIIKKRIIERNRKDLIQMYELCDVLWNFKE